MDSIPHLWNGKNGVGTLFHLNFDDLAGGITDAYPSLTPTPKPLIVVTENPVVVDLDSNIGLLSSSQG